MNFVILTEGGQSRGFGHISRCLSFYDALIAKGHSVEFLIQGDASVKGLLDDRVYSLLDWTDDIVGFLESHAACQVIILDSFSVSQESVSYLCQSDVTVVAIDDYRRYSFSDSIVVDWTVNVETTGKHNHNEGRNRLLLGLNYLVLRKPFLNFEGAKTRSLRNLLISLGGSDTRGLTSPLVQHLAARFPELEIGVVVGPGYRDEAGLSSFADSGIALWRSPDSSGMKRLIVDCDLAITTGGQILYELAVLAKPTVAIQVAENQKEDIEGWKEKGLLYSVFAWDDELLFEKLSDSIVGLRDTDVRRDLTNRISGTVRGDGIVKILEIIEQEVNDKTGK